MDKYLEAIANLCNRMNCHRLQAALDAVMEVAQQDYYADGLTYSEYSEVCAAAHRITEPEIA